MNKQYERRRRKYNVKEIRFLTNEFQIHFIIKFCLAVIIGAVLSGGIIYLMSKQSVTTTFKGARLQVMSTADFILPSILLSSAIVIVFIGLSALAITFFAYRRMKQYLCQIKEEVEKAGKGDYNVQLNFRRRDDQFKILANGLHKLIHDFRNTVISIKGDVMNLESALEEFEQEEDSRTHEKVKKELESLKNQISKIKA